MQSNSLAEVKKKSIENQILSEKSIKAIASVNSP